MMRVDLERRWAAQGICRPEDDDLFFAGTDGHTPGPSTKAAWNRAKEICAMCPALEACRRDTVGETHGVWGGLDPLERRRKRQRLAHEVKGWSQDERLIWGKELHALRKAGAKWQAIQTATGMPTGTAEQLVHEWAAHLADTAQPAPKVVDLPLPEPEERAALPFPDRPGERHAWVRHNGMVTDGWYRGQTGDGEWVRVETWAGRGRSVSKWVHRDHVKIYQPQPVVVMNYAGRPDASAA